MKRGHAVTGGAGLTKLQEDVSFCTGAPALRGKSLEPRITDLLRSISYGRSQGF